MNKYIITYTLYTPSDGYVDYFFVHSTLEEAKEKVLVLQNNKHLEISDIQIYAAEEITKFVNFIKETL